MGKGGAWRLPATNPVVPQRCRGCQSLDKGRGLHEAGNAAGAADSSKLEGRGVKVANAKTRGGGMHEAGRRGRGEGLPGVKAGKGTQQNLDGLEVMVVVGGKEGLHIGQVVS